MLQCRHLSIKIQGNLPPCVRDIWVGWARQLEGSVPAYVWDIKSRRSDKSKAMRQAYISKTSIQIHAGNTERRHYPSIDINDPRWPQRGEEAQLGEHLSGKQNVPSSNLGLTSVFPFFSNCRQF